MTDKEIQNLLFPPMEFLATGLLRTSWQHILEHEAFETMRKVLKKHRLYMITLGNNEDEIYWHKGNIKYDPENHRQTGREFLTLYPDKEGFRVIEHSRLEQELAKLMDWEDFCFWRRYVSHPSFPFHFYIDWFYYSLNKYGSSRKILELRNSIINETPVMPSLKSFVECIQSRCTDCITVYRVHSKANGTRMWLEQILAK